MCQITAIKYKVCGHEMRETHECQQSSMFCEIGVEDEVPEIRTRSFKFCPKCSAQNDHVYDHPPPAPTANLPEILQPGSPLFNALCRRAYRAWTKDDSIPTALSLLTVQRSMVEAAVAEAAEDEAQAGEAAGPGAPVFLQVPLSIHAILVTAICRELFFMAMRATRGGTYS